MSAPRVRSGPSGRFKAPGQGWEPVERLLEVARAIKHQAARDPLARDMAIVEPHPNGLGTDAQPARGVPGCDELRARRRRRG